MPRSDKFFVVPKGSRGSECRGRDCRATVYWVENPDTGRRVPVDCDVAGGAEPTEWSDGQGVSHFTTCANANDFSRGGRR